MILNLRRQTGLPIKYDVDSCKLILGDGLNRPSYRVKTLRGHDPVWANPVHDEDRAIYYYTSSLWLAGDESQWKKSRVEYGIVVFPPGIFGGEYVKSAGQYHPLCGNNRQATPEVYTVLHGTGHFLLQKSAPPYDVIEDAVLVEVEEGETFVVPPDYGHLQINPSDEPLIFSYTVMQGMNGVYQPFRQRRGAIYYEMADGSEHYVFNTRYADKMPLRIVKASEICQVPLLSKGASYHAIRDLLPELAFLTDPTLYPDNAHLGVGGAIPGGRRYDAADKQPHVRRTKAGASRRNSLRKG
jgi:glucose-6-phosphate isomerase, archaeal